MFVIPLWGIAVHLSPLPIIWVQPTDITFYLTFKTPGQKLMSISKTSLESNLLLNIYKVYIFIKIRWISWFFALQNFGWNGEIYLNPGYYWIRGICGFLKPKIVLIPYYTVIFCSTSYCNSSPSCQWWLEVTYISKRMYKHVESHSWFSPHWFWRHVYASVAKYFHIHAQIRIICGSVELFY